MMKYDDDTKKRKRNILVVGLKDNRKKITKKENTGAERRLPKERKGCRSDSILDFFSLQTSQFVFGVFKLKDMTLGFSL